MYLQTPVGSTVIPRDLKNYWTFDKKVNVEGVEYDQYVHNVEITADGEIQKKDFNFFANYNNKTSNYYRDDIFITPPDNLQQAGSNFKIRYGVEYYFVNHAPDIRFLEKEYSYTNKAAWSLHESPDGIRNDSGSAAHIITRTDATDPSRGAMILMGWTYADVNSTKNIGSEAIK